VRILLDAVMERRSRQLAGWLAPHLPAAGRVADIGAGTGHTARALARGGRRAVINVDVVNMLSGAGELVLFDGQRLPFPDRAFDAGLLLFVLQYAGDPARLLREAARICAGPLLVLQSSYQSAAGHAALRANDIAWGPVAYHLARAAGFISAERCTLHGRHYFTPAALRQTFARAGLRAKIVHTVPWPLAAVRYNLLLAEPQDRR
jgi:SAM-dependent methyltransferase